VASYLVSILQGANTERIEALFEATGFWDAIASDPFFRDEWLKAIRGAPSVKEGIYTGLSSRDVIPEVEQILNEDRRLACCFVSGPAAEAAAGGAN
jgi:glycerol-1-phosphate dehydrogenase [NAD(P)+]